MFDLDNPSSRSRCPEGKNHGYYRIGRDLDRNGNVTGGWGRIIPVSGWFGAENQGAGIDLANINGRWGKDMVIFHVDNPGGENHGYYRVIPDLWEGEPNVL